MLREMKRVKSGRGGREELPQTVEGADSEEEIVDKFRTVYSTLYNCAVTKLGMDVLREKVKWMITPEDIGEVIKISTSAVKQAVNHLKARKSDILEGCTSDGALNAMVRT